MNKKLKYGDTTTYSHNLDEERLLFLSKKYNRAKHQTQFLYNLLDGNYNALVQLENAIKFNFVAYCPSTMEEVRKILKGEK